MRSLKLKITKQIILELVVTLFMGARLLRSILSGFTDSPSLMTAIILLLALFICFITQKIDLYGIVGAIIPPIVVFVLLGLTWSLYPERHDFYLNSIYPISALLYPTSCVYILSIAMIVQDKCSCINILKYYGIIQFLYSTMEVWNVIQTGYWTRGSIYGGEIVTVITNYNLTWGYDMLAACIVFAGIYLLCKRKIYIVMISLGIVGIFMYGSRGPLLIFGIYIVLLYLLYQPDKKGIRVLIASIFVIILFLLASIGALQYAIKFIADILNINSRTLEKLIEGTIASDSGRIQIYATVIGKIIQNPIWGYGIYSDRFFMNMLINGGSAYSHNIILEMWLSFGIIGLLFCFVVMHKIVQYFKKILDTELRIALLISIGGTLPLFLSLTFWSQPLFWFMLSLLFNKRLSVPHTVEYRQTMK